MVLLFSVSFVIPGFLLSSSLMVRGSSCVSCLTSVVLLSVSWVGCGSYPLMVSGGLWFLFFKCLG